MREDRLGPEEKRYLLELARRSVEAHLAGQPLPPSDAPAGPLAEPAGAFVTLKKLGQLRGCIGYITAREPLVRVVQENAINAAFRDPRFPPLEAHELPEVHFEISVLTPPVEVSNPSEIVVGRDGLIVESGPFRGLLLPQVAVELGWDRTRFLEETCRKAGLDRDCWQRPGTRILRFSAEVFGEPE